MASGLPVVTTDAGNARIIVGETGHVVNRGDDRALVRAWRELLSDDKLGRSPGRQARLRLEEQYSLGAVVSQYEDLYRSLAGVRA